MTFANSQIETSDLPSISQVEFQKLAPAYRNVEYIGMSILSAFLFIGPVVVFFNVPESFLFVRYGVFVVWALIFAGGMYLAGKQYEMAGYALRQHDVIHKHGVWWRTMTTIPFNRMQHCEISQGPIQNIFGLATLRVFTAGGTSSDLAIDGLEKAEAERIKEFITGKINEKAEDKSKAESQDDTDIPHHSVGKSKIDAETESPSSFSNDISNGNDEMLDI
jgi:membrane protein YdbS with pleckstrin-like domain